ncbi:lasso peptide biosynthesis B2 protein [Spirosoma sp. HMF4905]|uniref:Lasso peptide biosynthesis B2 protein n=1 Tax=Spirosoma arboris TaxID=2682092 RepID=A0A7K1SA15_9BACT|nr:lasso peptide biosynthesis B2 protein [Spirosoma arboris]MVM30649.1 lasso peptide biosynthesis B2 protein [Spirosoma arboris]
MKDWWKRFSEFSHLSLADKLLIGQTVAIMIVIRAGLKLLSFQQFRKLYGKLLTVRKSTTTSDKLIERQVWAIQKVSGTLAAVCLPQALALTYFLRKEKGIELVVGVQKKQAFEAHAWVEKSGRILIGESPDNSFKPLWVWQ